MTICTNLNCLDAVEEDAETGRWRITNGHPGCTNPQNRRSGFHSREKAMEVFRSSVYYGRRYNGLSLNDIASMTGGSTRDRTPLQNPTHSGNRTKH